MHTPVCPRPCGARLTVGDAYGIPYAVCPTCGARFKAMWDKWVKTHAGTRDARTPGRPCPGCRAHVYVATGLRLCPECQGRTAPPQD